MARLPRVSVVMPVYNGGAHFEAAVRSVLAQSYPEIEIVIVNDGSTDRGRTHRVCTRLAARHPDRIVYVRQPNQGVSGALNTGVDTMTGDFFAWLSHDDLYHPDKIARQVDFHRRLGSPDAVVFTDWTYIDEKGEHLYDIRLPAERLRQTSLFAALGGCVNGCTVLIPAHVIRDSYPFETQYRHVQDYRMWFRMLRRYAFFHLPELLVKQRIHPGQDSLKPEAVTEGEGLWTEMVFGLTSGQRAQVAGSSLLFYEEMAHRLSQMPYPATQAAVADAARSCLARTLVSVVLPVGDDPSAAESSLDSVLAQTHGELEVLLVAAEGSEALERLRSRDQRIRVLPQPANGADGFVPAFSAAAGEYLALLQPGDRFAPRKLEIQLERMMREGAAVSHSSYDGPSGALTLTEEQAQEPAYPGLLIHGRLAPSTLMFHRIVADSGMFDPDLDGGDLALGVVRWARAHPVLAIPQALTH